MAKITLSTKRLQIDRANFVVVIAVAAATFVTIFSLVTCKALFSQRSYQAKVISQREDARDQLQENVKAAAKLQTAYKQFVETQANVIGGSTSGNGKNDGDNARIVLDALPGQYDFPALATSLEKVAQDNNVELVSISGTDDEVGQLQNKESPEPKPVDMPFQLNVKATYLADKNLINIFEKSIRPFSISKLEVTADSTGGVGLDITGKSYYQPATSLNVKWVDVR